MVSPPSEVVPPPEMVSNVPDNRVPAGRALGAPLTMKVSVLPSLHLIVKLLPWRVHLPHFCGSSCRESLKLNDVGAQ